MLSGFQKGFEVSVSVLLGFGLQEFRYQGFFQGAVMVRGLVFTGSFRVLCVKVRVPFWVQGLGFRCFEGLLSGFP